MIQDSRASENFMKEVFALNYRCASSLLDVRIAPAAEDDKEEEEEEKEEEDDDEMVTSLLSEAGPSPSPSYHSSASAQTALPPFF